MSDRLTNADLDAILREGLSLARVQDIVAECRQRGADLAAHKAALADVVERAARVADFWAEAKPVAKGTDPSIVRAVNMTSKNVAAEIRSLAPPDAAPYAKVLEAARRYDEARIARPLLYAKKRAEYRLLDNLTVTYLREADEPLAQAQADLHEALAAIEEPRR